MTHIDITYICLLWYHHNEKLKTTPRMGVNKSCAICVNDYYVRKCGTLAWVSTSSQSTTGKNLIVMALGNACHGLPAQYILSYWQVIEPCIQDQGHDWANPQIPSLWDFEEPFLVPSTESAWVKARKKTQ